MLERWLPYTVTAIYVRMYVYVDRVRYGKFALTFTQQCPLHITPLWCAACRVLCSYVGGLQHACFIGHLVSSVDPQKRRILPDLFLVYQGLTSVCTFCKDLSG